MMFLKKIYTCLDIILPAQNGGKGVPILLYHGVNDSTFGMEELFVRPAEFEMQMKYLHDNRYTPITFEEIEQHEKFSKPVIITFDDGNTDNFQYAYPVLKKYNMKATIFMIAGYIDHPEYLSARQMQQMSDIISFQSHTFSHSRLSLLPDEKKREEFVKSKEMIEKNTQKPVIALSYPYGDFDPQVGKIASDHFDFCVTTKKGFYSSLDDRHRIRRLSVLRLEGLESFIRKLK